MKKLATLLVLGMASSAFAGSLNFEARVDADSTTYNDAAKAGGVKDNYKMRLQTGRLDYKGKLNEEVSFRLRARFNQDASGTKTKDNTGSFVDFANVNHKLSDAFDLTFGKFGTDIAGWEGAVAGSDHYFTSVGYGEGTSSVGALYATGVKAHYVAGMADLTFLAANNTNDGGTPYQQTKMFTGVAAKFKLMEGMLTPLLSYHQGSGAESADRKDTFTTVGVRYASGAIGADLDYDMYSYADKTFAGQKDTTNSIVAAGSYKMSDSMTYKAKLESSEAKVNTSASASTKTTTTAMGLVAEYKPFADDSYRYHVAVTDKTWKTDAANAQNQKETHLIAGMKIYADFLK